MVRFKIKLISAITIIAALYSCSKKPSKMEFISLKQYDYADTSLLKGKIYVTKVFNFIVKDYENNEYGHKKIDSFAFHQYKERCDVNSCHILFYGYSDITNPKNLKTYPKDFHRDTQDDILFRYTWFNGKLITKAVYDNGKRID